ncbi:MAG TPA: transglycosylase SLT domain-containing protein [Candidatus Binataceae bacterium]|nr:transglycosylase SLT domain-containing protein [Candidatus Binataceae bacterium]
MRGKRRNILLIALMLLPAYGCTQALDLQSQRSDQIIVTGGVAASGDTARLLSSTEASGMARPEGAVAPADLPFVRSQPKAVPPFPLVLNRTVQAYVDDYLSQPQGLKRSFRRSEAYMPEMVSLLQAEGLPPDLVYLAFAESGFSSAGAGPWQLSKATARRYGLTINRWVDERRDPIKSTRAAAEYLATLHDETGRDWRMTLVAWNNGDAGVDRYLRLADAPYERLLKRLPRRTRSLMNRFMAVALIARHADEYGLRPVSYEEPFHYRVIREPGGERLSRIASEQHVSVRLLRELNPALLKDRTPPAAESYSIRVPDNTLRADIEPQDF